MPPDPNKPKAFIAALRAEDRSALRLVLHDLKFNVVGEAADWETALLNLPSTGTDVLVVDSHMLARCPSTELEAMRQASPVPIAIILIGGLDAYEQAAVSSGADVFISRADSPEHVAERFKSFATSHAGDEVV